MPDKEFRCQLTTVLKKPRQNEARKLLEEIAKRVQPIMRKRRWTVKKLSEFSPRNPGLLGLNVNRGAEVKIRLRPAHADDSFYEWHHVLGTMLHELAHNEVSAHNAAFYKLLDELWAEAEELMDRGITGTGQGFDAPSAGRLGSHAFIPTHNPPPHKMTDAVRKAAEARARQQTVMPSGPQRLGTAARSGIDYKQLTPAQAAAAAAERRARDNVWCGAEHSAEEGDREVGAQVEGLAAAAADVGGGGVGGGDAAGPPAGVPAAATAAAAAGQAAGVLLPTGTAQQQQQQLPPVPSTQATPPYQASTAPGQANPNLSEQQAALHQQWQQHLLQQRQRQQQQQQQQRKRPAAETIDLTLTDSDDEGTGGGSFSGAAALVPGCCPCCAAAVQGPLDAAVMQQLRSRQGFQQWCALHQQVLGSGGQLVAPNAAVRKGSWTCSICTLINPPDAAACEACHTVKP